MNKAKLLIVGILALLVLATASGRERRRISPVETQAAQTQSINETANDTSRINAKRRAAAGMTYVNDNGFTVYVDTITGDEWIDSTVISRVPKMEYPLFHALSVGLNVWDPLMRAFGQHYGIADAWVELSLHNRYKPIFEAGLGTAKYTPSGMNFTYRSPMSVYFRLGANYNFFFNSDPAYSLFAGVRYGFSPFSFAVDNVTVKSPYWGETATFDIPSQHVTAGWFEFTLGLRVKIWGPISAGWTFRYKQLLHESKGVYGKPWYIPGYGTRNAIGGSFSIVYTLPLDHLNKPTGENVVDIDAAVDKAAPVQQITTTTDQ